MNLQNLKNTYAQEQGYPNWNELRYWRDISEVADGYMDEICIRAQKEALEKASKNGVAYKLSYPNNTSKAVVEKSSITNHENLIL